MLKQKTVYFREEDLPLWENIQNKAQFLHDALAGNSGRTIVGKDVPMEKLPVVPLEWTKPKPRVREIKDTKNLPKHTAKWVEENKTQGGITVAHTYDAFVPKPPAPETGYPCCTKQRPCKHWQWDSGKTAYVNTLTGKLREPDL